jgi:hypothetical protein
MIGYMTGFIALSNYADGRALSSEIDIRLQLIIHPPRKPLVLHRYTQY